MILFDGVEVSFARFAKEKRNKKTKMIRLQLTHIYGTKTNLNEFPFIKGQTFPNPRPLLYA